MPYIDVHFIGKPDTIFNPVGARGAGEIGVTGIPAAIANAVYNATGQRVRDFPITLDKLIVPTHSLARSTAVLSEFEGTEAPLSSLSESFCVSPQF